MAMWRTVLQLPRHALGFLSRGEGALAALSKQVSKLADLLRDSAKCGDAARDELRKVRQELADLRREVHDRLLQNTMTVTRAARALEQGASGHVAAGNGDVRLSSRPIAVEPGESVEHEWEPVFGAGWTVLHGPAVTVPVFKGPRGLPIGAQIIGPPGKDGPTLQCAEWVHRALTA